MATAPQITPYDRYRIREGRRLLFISGRCANRPDFGLDQPVGHQRDHREQSEKRRRRSSNRQVAPLSLGFYSQMRPRLFEAYFHPPASHEPTQNLQRRMVEVGRQQRPGFEFIQRIADQYPMNWD